MDNIDCLDTDEPLPDEDYFHDPIEYCCGNDLERGWCTVCESGPEDGSW